MPQLNAFIARSFAPQDEDRIRPVLEFLDTFRKLGFFCESADAAEVESVSKKVRDMIEEKQVFIGFFTRKHPVYAISSKFRAARQILLGTIQPQVWSAPAWVLQESGYALRGGKDLILLREVGVEVFGLQADLEYIPFDAEKPADVFLKLNQMINGLLAKASGTEVRLLLTERDEKEKVAIEASTAVTEAEAPKAGVGGLDVFQHFYWMTVAARNLDLGKVQESWEAGTALIAEGKSDDFDQLAWDCLYYQSRFTAGDASGLETLRKLHADNPTRPEPTAALARCLNRSKEFEEAANLFLEAANLQEGATKARSLVNAGKAFEEIKAYKRGLQAIELALAIATGDPREEAISLKYQMVKDSGSDYFAFAIAEFALHENPGLGLRFQLGLDYHRRDLNELGLYHFKYLHEMNYKNSDALHNLALLQLECKLPITSVDNYKKAFEMGETLSAGNLGYMYLDGGMAEEAKSIIDEAMKVAAPNLRVVKCLAEITQRGEQEVEKEKEALETANTKRGFFVGMGKALAAETPLVTGRWRFPFGEMNLSVVASELTGIALIERERSSTGLIFSIDPPSPKTDQYTLKGQFTGAVCKFEITVAEMNPPAMALPSLWSLATGPKNGMIVFARDGKSASYVEISDRKLGKIETLAKVS